MVSHQSQPHSRPSDTSTSNNKATKILVSTSWEQNLGSKSEQWKPSAFRFSTLLSTTLICWGLIALLQILLVRSQRDGGIIFAPTVQSIDTAHTFSYLYLPTIISLLFSILWAWIDLQIRRLEPYYQLTKTGGVKGKNSLLLSYPFDFLPLVPFRAFRNRHWAVFWSSTSALLVTWAIVPLQAGIFAPEIISQTSAGEFSRSLNFIPSSQQSSSITNRFIQSAHGIIWLNETLPSYMTREYILEPFKLSKIQDSRMHYGLNQTWTADTTLYSLDMECETPTYGHENSSLLRNSSDSDVGEYYHSSNGCVLSPSNDPGLGNETIGPNHLFDNHTVFDVKEFSSYYFGFYDTDTTTFYLDGDCPKSANRTFVAMHTRNKKRDADPPQNVTKLLCTPFYYQQDVRATIDSSTKAPLNITTTSAKQPLPAEKWNSTFFELQMNGAENSGQSRAALPIAGWPDQLETLSSLNLSLGVAGAIVTNMVGLAIGAAQRPLEELLEPEALRSAYEASYRIIFARSMREILDQEFQNTKIANGTINTTTAAIVVVPVFAYVVQGLLGFVSLCSITLLFISVRRKWSLCSDPVTIASVMALVADNPSLLGDFAYLDRASKDDFSRSLQDKKFQLEQNGGGITVNKISSTTSLRQEEAHESFHPEPRDNQKPKLVQPREFSSLVLLPFLSLMVALALLLGLLTLRSWPYGLVPPSNNPVVRQILENYLPTAIATGIEPVWVLINHLLCLLQPLEDLRRGNALASRTVEADYNSLPPQLVIFKAFRSSHLKLAVVCMMALLANLLAVAFSGMFREASVPIPRKAFFIPPYESKFVSIDGRSGPSMGLIGGVEPLVSGAFTGGEGQNQFYVAESNLTAGTPLPAWTGEEFMYLPYASESDFSNMSGQSAALQATTTAIGAKLECQQIGSENWKAIWSYKGNNYIDISIIMDGITCEGQVAIYRGSQPPYCQDGNLAMELFPSLRAGLNASSADEDFCAQSVFVGFARDANVCSRYQDTREFGEDNMSFFGCQSAVVGHKALTTVNSEGRILSAGGPDTHSELSSDSLDQLFTNNKSNLLMQGNQFLLQNLGPTLHNDSFASDFMNYFMIKQGNDSGLVDPNLPLPSLEDVTPYLYPTYSKLFAIWLGINRAKLLVPRNEDSSSLTEGHAIQSGNRIFLSMPLFIIAEIILGIYVVVITFVYFARPGRFLPRLPTSIGAVIALFASSRAVRDMSGTSLLTKKQRQRHLVALGSKYGYGDFIGVDGQVHVGIEKEPLVKVLPLLGVFQRPPFKRRRSPDSSGNSPGSQCPGTR